MSRPVCGASVALRRWGKCEELLTLFLQILYLKILFFFFSLAVCLESCHGSSAGVQPATGRFQIWVWIFPTFTIPGLYFGLMSSVSAHLLNRSVVSTSIKNIVSQALKETGGLAQRIIQKIQCRWKWTSSWWLCFWLFSLIYVTALLCRILQKKHHKKCSI